MRDSVPSASYSSVCNVLRQWNISLIPTYRVYQLYDNVVLFNPAVISFRSSQLPKRSWSWKGATPMGLVEDTLAGTRLYPRYQNDTIG